MTYAVKVRKVGTKQWAFLTRNGVNRLRVHAGRFDTKEKAQALIDANAADNPEWEFRAVNMERNTEEAA